MQGFDAIQLTPVELGLSGCGENQFGIPELRWPASLAPENHTPAGCSKIPDFSPSQPWRPLHPPALSLPRQPLQPGTRFVPSKAAAEQEPEAYPLGRTVRRIRSTKFVRAAEW